MIDKIDHVALAVADLEAAIELYGTLWGLELSHREIVEDQGVEEAMFRIGESQIQLMRPLGPDTIIGKFIQRRGEGLHHIAYQVDDLEAALESLRSGGLHLVDEKPRRGSRGLRVAFVHPKDNKGLLVELVERPSPANPPGQAES
ncbi:MAG: methylmalonyl-CoA epimerase [Actinomycetota bacterium]